jgi:hypothetical protein
VTVCLCAPKAEALNGFIRRYPAHADAYLLLGGIYEQRGERANAGEIYNRGLAADGIPDSHKFRMKARLDGLKPDGAGAEKQ